MVGNGKNRYGHHVPVLGKKQQGSVRIHVRARLLDSGIFQTTMPSGRHDQAIGQRWIVIGLPLFLDMPELVVRGQD